ncbi:MAG: M48 family metalloprotease [Gammaproteobacteria bacterium]|nr:M48 family metalloprotease [Gammaproteobacteria bacterium]
MRRTILLAIVAATVLAGCATPSTLRPGVSSVAAELEAKTQRELALRAYFDENQRLQRVAYRILTRSVPLCGERVSYTIGMRATNNLELQDGWRDAAREALGITDLMQITFIAPQSPAQAAGLRVGDVLESIAGWSVPVGESAAEQTREQLAKSLMSGQPLSIQVRRSGEARAFTVTPVQTCAFDVVLDPSDIKNAYADGDRIVMHKGMMEFLRTDEEVAFIVSHELAHNAMGHIDSKKTNVIAGGAAGLLVDVLAAAAGVNTGGQFTELGAMAGAGAYSVEFEQEADYVGLYYMALAGFDIRESANFWRRIAIQSPQSIEHKSTHPTSPERFVAIAKTVKEIATKRSSGEPLQPNMEVKPKASTVPGADEQVDR